MSRMKHAAHMAMLAGLPEKAVSAIPRPTRAKPFLLLRKSKEVHSIYKDEPFTFNPPSRTRGPRAHGDDEAEHPKRHSKRKTMQAASKHGEIDAQQNASGAGRMPMAE